MKVPRPGGQTRAVARRKMDTARHQLEEAGGKTRYADEQKSHQAGRLGEPATNAEPKVAVSISDGAKH